MYQIQVHIINLHLSQTGFQCVLGVLDITQDFCSDEEFGPRETDFFESHTEFFFRSVGYPLVVVDRDVRV